MQWCSASQSWRCLGFLTSPFCSTSQDLSSRWTARETLAKVGTTISSGRADVVAHEVNARATGWVISHRTQALGRRCDLIPLNIVRLKGTASATPFFSRLNSTLTKSKGVYVDQHHVVQGLRKLFTLALWVIASKVGDR